MDWDVDYPAGNRENERRTMAARLQEKLALRRKKRDEDERIEQQAFESLAIQREEMVHQVLNTQPDLTKQ